MWCWHCCHPFPGPALHCPYRYDDRRRHFDTTGNFCSWECMKTYIIDKGSARSGEEQMILALMKKHVFGKSTPTHPAPKRTALKVFGGTLTIEEFRAGSSNVSVYMPYETHRMPVVVSNNSVPTRKPSDPPSTNDTLVLKRTKPLARAKSSLESSLGIIRNPRARDQVQQAEPS